MELFGCIRIVFVTKAFMYKLQTRILYRAIWSFWEFMQVVCFNWKNWFDKMSKPLRITARHKYGIAIINKQNIIQIKQKSINNAFKAQEIADVKNSQAETGRSVDLAGDGKYDSPGYVNFIAYHVLDYNWKCT